MFGLLLPVSIVALGGAAWYAHTRRDKAVTPQVAAERQAVFQSALDNVKDPIKLREIAKTFREQGLNAEADLLEKRAALRELPQDVKDGRREAFKKGMASSNPTEIRALANLFEQEGATGAAKALRDVAAGLEAMPSPNPADIQAAINPDLRQDPNIQAAVNPDPNVELNPELNALAGISPDAAVILAEQLKAAENVTRS